jgi:hypothetical protein
LNRSQAHRRPVGNSEVDLVLIQSSWVSDGIKNLSGFAVYAQFDWRIDHLRRIRWEKKICLARVRIGQGNFSEAIQLLLEEDRNPARRAFSVTLMRVPAAATKLKR